MGRGINPPCGLSSSQQWFSNIFPLIRRGHYERSINIRGFLWRLQARGEAIGSVVLALQNCTRVQDRETAIGEIKNGRFEVSRF